MTAIRKAAPDARRRLIAAVHMAAKKHGVEGDDYREMLRTVTGKDSCRQLSIDEMGRVLDRLNGGARARSTAEIPQARKVRALWISGYWLGVVRDNRDTALRAFVRRQTGIEAERWLRDPAEAGKVIEALKSWLTREAGVDWSSYLISHSGGRPIKQERPRQRVVEAQIRLLSDFGVRLDIDAMGRQVTGKPARFAWDDRDWDALIVALGRELRGHMGWEDAP